MKIKELTETTAGSIASVAQPIGGVQRRVAPDSFFGATQAEMPKRKKKKKKKTNESRLLDKPTMSVDQLAKLHGVKDDLIIHQLIKGTRIKMEHTTDEKIADEIARDHLKEDPLYYSHLEQMEDKYTK